MASFSLAFLGELEEKQEPFCAQGPSPSKEPAKEEKTPVPAESFQKKRSFQKLVKEAFGPEPASSAPAKPKGPDKKRRAPRGTAGTFAGRRPPTDPEKLEIYDKMREDYDRLRMEAAGSRRKVSISQSAYYDHMRAAMTEMGTEAPAQERFRQAAKLYRCKTGLL